MGFFNLISPFLSFIDKIFSFFPTFLRLIIWGLGGSALSMWLYVRLSSQKKLARVQEKIATVRKALASYNGKFDGAQKLINESLMLSFQEIGLVIVPAIVASLPMLFLLVWVNTNFSHSLPAPDSPVSIKINPDTAQVQWQPPAIATKQKESWQMSWVSLPNQASLNDAQGQEILKFPLSKPIPIIHQRKWWNGFFGNPLGYIPSNSPVESITIGLIQREFIPFGPDWLRSVDTFFLLIVLIFSIIIKLVFRIR